MPFIKKRVLHNHYSWISLPIICLVLFRNTIDCPCYQRIVREHRAVRIGRDSEVM